MLEAKQQHFGYAEFSGVKNAFVANDDFFFLAHFKIPLKFFIITPYGANYLSFSVTDNSSSIGGSLTEIYSFLEVGTFLPT